MIFFTVCMRVRMRQGKDLLVMVFLCLALSALLTGCAERIVVSAIGPDGTLAILKPDSQFSRALAKGQWVIVGDPSPGALVITKQDGIPALKFTHSSDDFFLVRPIEANLMATPYLDWSWRMSAHEGPYHSVSLMIGMRAPEGSPHASTPSLAPWIRGTTGANRILSIRWSKSALERGYLAPHPGSSSNAIIYSARGGTENAGLWWRESLDLSRLYGQAWPSEDLTKSRIVFIALKADSPIAASPAYIFEIRLFR